MTQSQFRNLVLVTFALCWTSALVDFLFPSLLTDELLRAKNSLNQQWTGTSAVAFMLLSLTSTVLMTAAMYGLWSFKTWGPKLALFATVLPLLVVMQYGGLVQSGVAYSLHAASWLTWGASLLIPFLSPYSTWFKTAQPTPAIAA
ncbi:hypothetical protein [Rubrivivax rivuli]|uniref:Uncharacterized protein n=1 Tax=Rubrivivax rivuli TaxID=1862385 RepID=A0A437RJY7_9BURK|nr:hypothetical protein [Rubrivivax rivuli]RVU47058.1 hypothetical protein EOE66_04635 [Rubrivivax rivuli]